MSTTDLPGSGLLAGRYRLVERLGAGGMSVVWRAFDEVLGRQVAVKVLPPSTSADPSFRRRLRAEAQAAARLSHPHITNVYDYGEATTADGEPVPYVVMELVDGESLAAVLARTRTLPWSTAVRISAEVSAALAAAHARGIVHRDVTPANVMLTTAGAKVVDFGISALIGENDTDPDGSLLGTPAYLAPERLEGGQVSPATDVYAVGLLIYRMLIGQLPWDVGTTTALLRAHQYMEPEPLPPVEGLPSEVGALIGRCLEKRPADRPGSAEVAHVLAGVSAGAPVVPFDFDADWEEGGVDTTILPPQFPPAAEPPGPAIEPPAVAPLPLRRGAAEESAAPAAPGPLRNARTRRILVLAGTVALLTALTYGWTMVGEPEGDEPANAAATPPPPSVVPASGKCIVSYAVFADSGGRFKAQMTLANREDRPVGKWKLWFLVPGDQVLSGNGTVALQQAGKQVTVSSEQALDPLGAVTFDISGRYQQRNPAPMVFQLNRQTCEAFVSSEPGEPSRPVEILSNGNVRLGPPVTARPGVPVDRSGIVRITPSAPGTKTSRPTRSSAPPSVRPSTSKPVVEPEPPSHSARPSESESKAPPSSTPGASTEPCDIAQPLCDDTASLGSSP